MNKEEYFKQCTCAGLPMISQKADCSGWRIFCRECDNSGLEMPTRKAAVRNWNIKMSGHKLKLVISDINV